MRTTLLHFIVFFSMAIHAQSPETPDPLAGHYTATANGDNLTMTLRHASGSSYEGVMKDSYQTYLVAIEMSGTDITGTATESSLALEFQISGQVRGTQLPLQFTLEYEGEKNTMDILFIREGNDTPALSGTGAQTPSTLVFPPGATHPEEVVGTWTKEELYQSGYGDNYMGAGFSQSMTLLPDGHLAEDGTTSYISGGNYSGQSSGQGGGVMPGLAWYTIGNQLYLQITENGKTENELLGRYYVENNNMLITATNGEKTLLKRSN